MSTTQASPQPSSPMPPPPEKHAPPAHPRRKRVIAAAVIVPIIVGVAYWVIGSLGIVSTDDAYVSGHVTFVAPRVAGQVIRVLVDDNNRVRKGDVLVQIDREPLELQVKIDQAAVVSAQSDLVIAQAQARGLAAQARSLRFALDHAMEDVNNQAALLAAKVAALKSRQAVLDNARVEYERFQKLFESKAASLREIDDHKEAFLVAQAGVEEALQAVYQIRVGLGLPPTPPGSDDLTQVPADLDQTASAVRQAQASLIESIAQLGVTDSFNKPPRQMLADFYKRDPDGDIDKILVGILKDAPTVKQAEARLVQAQRRFDQDNLNLSYCDVVAEIDGVVTRRNVNPGNNVVPGQSLMAVRSLREIWVDANFKETQLAHLRIGHPVDLEVDMYGRHAQFKGRISGFTMGTGSTLALLPAQNATGNFVKVVQRLPVRIELIDYDPDKMPLFIGLSVTPRVHVNEPPTGPDAGKVLQPYDAVKPAAGGAPEARP